MKSIGAEFYLRPEALPGVKPHAWEAISNSSKHKILTGTLLIHYKFACTIPTQNININIRSKPSFSRVLRHTWLKAVMLFYSYITRNCIQIKKHDKQFFSSEGILGRPHCSSVYLV